MKKISTLYKKDPNDLGRVINEINPDNQWVFTDEGVNATRKWDGTACAIINKELYKRYDVKKGKQVPAGAIPCQDADAITGHWPHWIKCDINNPADRWHFEGLASLNHYLNIHNAEMTDGTFELVGPKVHGNPEKLESHHLMRHGMWNLRLHLPRYNFELFREFLEADDIEGIVFHHPDGRMCKLRKSDYGIKR